MIFELQDLDTHSCSHLPENCRKCGWWQGYDHGWQEAEAQAWSEAALEIFGPWGKLALTDGTLTGMIQFGPAVLFSRSSHLPAKPVSSEAVLLTCGRKAETALGSVVRSLLTATMADLHRRGVSTVEAFTTDSTETDCRYFREELLREVGFYAVRKTRGVRLMRLEMGGLQPLKERRLRRGLLDRIKQRSSAPVPVAMSQHRSVPDAGWHESKPLAVKACAASAAASCLEHV